MLLFTLLALTAPFDAYAQTVLPLGATTEGRLSGEAPLDYRLTVPGAGVLTLLVDGGGDLTLQLMDADGQPLDDGRADGDMDGLTGREMLSVRVTEGGSYRLRVSDIEGSGSNFRIGTAFLEFPAFAKAADSDGRPSGAQTLTVGRPVEEALDPSAGDSRDWFVFTAEQDGTLALVTRAIGDSDGLDLVLEAFFGGVFLEPTQRSDQDLQEDYANEGITLAVRAGQKIHVRVSSTSGSGGRYRLSSSLFE